MDARVRTEINAKPIGQFADWWASPAVVGLMGFALATIATGLANVLATGIGASVALALAFGGTAQFIAGWVDLRKGSIFSGSAFVSYGAFWWAYVILAWILPAAGITVTPAAELAFFACWTLFTTSFCLAVGKVGKVLTALFWLLLLAFLLLDLVVVGLFPAALAGYEIVLVGLVAWYIATSELVNTVYGKEVLPLP